VINLLLKALRRMTTLLQRGFSVQDVLGRKVNEGLRGLLPCVHKVLEYGAKQSSDDND